MQLCRPRIKFWSQSLLSRESMDIHLVVRKTSFIATYWCTCVLWSSKTVLTKSGARHKLRYYCLNKQPVDLCAYGSWVPVFMNKILHSGSGFSVTFRVRIIKERDVIHEKGSTSRHDVGLLENNSWIPLPNSYQDLTEIGSANINSYQLLVT